MSVRVRVDVDMRNIQPKIVQAGKTGLGILTMQVIKDSNYFVPVDQHFLEASALVHSRPEEGQAIWWTRYAKRLYYNPQYNFSTDKNPRAQGLWFEKAKSVYGKQWAEVADKAVKAGL